MLKIVFLFIVKFEHLACSEISTLEKSVFKLNVDFYIWEGDRTRTDKIISTHASHSIFEKAAV